MEIVKDSRKKSVGRALGRHTMDQLGLQSLELILGPVKFVAIHQYSYIEEREAV